MVGPQAAPASGVEAPVHGLVLTWKQDPTTTMTIDWHEKAPVKDPVLLYRQAGAGEWTTVAAAEMAYPFSDSWKVYRKELTGLKAGTEYEFRPHGRAKVYKFRTMPAKLERPLRVVVGGDVAYKKVPDTMNQMVAKLEPDLILWGGDYAYSNGSKDLIEHEVLFHNSIRDNLVGADGRVFPILGAIGNHEVSGNSAAYYFATFAWPGKPPYGVMDFADYLSVVVLDSNHIAKVPGEQTEWLKKTLAERPAAAGRVVFPLYHVGAYPSVRDPKDKTATAIRENWVPLFEKAGLSAVFEFHDHAYKRTHPLLGGEVQDSPAKGVTFLGDGAWGATTREPKKVEERPYLAVARKVNHVYLVEVPREGPLKFKAIDLQGQVFDEFELPRRRQGS